MKNSNVGPRSAVDRRPDEAAPTKTSASTIASDSSCIAHWQHNPFVVVPVYCRRAVGVLAGARDNSQAQLPSWPSVVLRFSADIAHIPVFRMPNRKTGIVHRHRSVVPQHSDNPQYSASNQDVKFPWHSPKDDWHSRSIKLQSAPFRNYEQVLQGVSFASPPNLGSENQYLNTVSISSGLIASGMAVLAHESSCASGLESAEDPC